MKKVLSLALVLALCLGLMVPAAAAQADFQIENGVLVKYKGGGGDVVIPDGVTKIGTYAFSECREMTSVKIPNSVTVIEKGAFSTCLGLTSVTIPNGVTEISEFCFSYCHNLSSITIPVSVTEFANGALYACRGLKDVYYAGTEAQWKSIFVSKIYGNPLEEATIHYNSGAPAPSVPSAPAATPTNDKLAVNGVLQNPTVYKIDGNNYFKIRDLAAMLNGTEKQFDVGYDAALSSVTATTGQPYAKLNTDLVGAATGGSQSASVSNDAIYIDGEKIDAAVYKINGNNYFKLRDLGKALDFYVGWSQSEGVFLDTTKPYSE